MVQVLDSRFGGNPDRADDGATQQNHAVKNPCVYILASRRNGTLYIGVTGNLAERIWKHRDKSASVFTSKYGVNRLVWYEFHETMEPAIAREKQIKKWRRTWKLELVESFNPRWEDLYDQLNS